MRIHLYEHPLAPVAPRVFEAASLAEWLLGHFGDTPQVCIQIFEGEPSAEAEITGDLQKIMSAAAPHYTVLQSPGWNFIGSIVVSLVLSVASAILFPPPDMPANVNRTQASPNNALGARENQARLLQRVEDIFGTVRAIPSMIMQTYNKYIGHKRVEVGYYCISRGYCSVQDLKDGETALAEIDGASAAVYHPFTSPNSGAPILQIGPSIVDRIMTVRRSVEIDGVTLKALNQVQLSAPAHNLFIPAGFAGDIEVPGGTLNVEASPHDRVGHLSQYPDLTSLIEVGQQISISVPPVVKTGSVTLTSSAATSRFGFDPLGFQPDVEAGDSITVTGFPFWSSSNGTFEVTEVGEDYIGVSGSLSDHGPTATTVVQTIEILGFDGTRTVVALAQNAIFLEGATFPHLYGDGPAYVPSSVLIVGVTDWTDWITLPQQDRSEVWVNVIAPAGMYADAGGGKTIVGVFFEMQVERLTALLEPTGHVETVPGSLAGATTDERAITLERVTSWIGPARVRMRRTSPYLYMFGGTLIDEIKWADLYSVSPVDRAHFGNKTTIHTVTHATPRATAARQRQLNCIATRLLPMFDGNAFSGGFDGEGRHTWGTIGPTRRMADIMAAVTVDPKIGRRQIGDLDMQQIWGVQQQLDAWHPDVGTFNYTIDSDGVSYEETLAMVANAGFCIAYRQNGRVRLAYDRAQSFSAALFTHRNKRPDAETVTRVFASDSDYDGVEFVYQDPETLRAETIRLPLDGSYTKLKKLEIPGIRSFTQAWYRASREYARLRHQRLTIETETTTDARLLLPNSRIDIVDNTVFRAFDGEVVGQEGMALTLSRDVEFEPAAAHSILLMRRDGAVQSIAVTAGAAANQIILQALPSEAVVTEEGEEGVRTIFSFSSDSARHAQAWLVQEVEFSEGDYMRVRAINYSASYYEGDTAPVPPKASVIL